MSSNNNNRNHVFHSFRHFPNLKMSSNQAEDISSNNFHNHHNHNNNNHHHNNHNNNHNNTKKEFYDTTYRIGNHNTDRPCLYHIEKELKTLKKSSIKVLKTDMDKFRTTLIHSRDKERGILKDFIKTTTRSTRWNEVARSCIVTDFRPQSDGDKPKGYGYGYGYGERFYKQTKNSNSNSSNNSNNNDDDDDNFDALQSVAEKLMNNVGIDINDNTLLSLLNDNDDNNNDIYNWKELQQRIQSYLGIPITNEEAQILMSRLY